MNLRSRKIYFSESIDSTGTGAYLVSYGETESQGGTATHSGYAGLSTE